MHWDIMHYPSLKRAANHAQHVAALAKKAVQEEQNASRKERLNDNDTGPKALSAALKTDNCKPLNALQRSQNGPCGEPPGSWATNPAEIDTMLRASWDPIYQGNIPPHQSQQHTSNFFSRYANFIHIAPPQQVDDLHWQDLKNACLKSSKSSPGLDQWHPADFAMLSDLAFQWLASLLNLIENGAPWPKATLHAKAAFLPKDPDNQADPMAYRILLILSTLYRKWAATRLHSLYPWVESWANSSLFAGVPGRGL